MSTAGKQCVNGAAAASNVGSGLTGSLHAHPNELDDELLPLLPRFNRLSFSLFCGDDTSEFHSPYGSGGGGGYDKLSTFSAALQQQPSIAAPQQPYSVPSSSWGANDDHYEPPPAASASTISGAAYPPQSQPFALHHSHANQFRGIEEWSINPTFSSAEPNPQSLRLPESAPSQGIDSFNESVQLGPGTHVAKPVAHAGNRIRGFDASAVLLRQCQSATNFGPAGGLPPLHPGFPNNTPMFTDTKSHPITVSAPHSHPYEAYRTHQQTQLPLMLQSVTSPSHIHSGSAAPIAQNLGQRRTVAPPSEPLLSAFRRHPTDPTTATTNSVIRLGQSTANYLSGSPHGMQEGKLVQPTVSVATDFNGTAVYQMHGSGREPKRDLLHPKPVPALGKVLDGKDGKETTYAKIAAKGIGAPSKPVGAPSGVSGMTVRLIHAKPGADTSPKSAPPPKKVSSTLSDLYKTEICQNWLRTKNCSYGNKCHYAHGKADMRARKRIQTFKTQPCADPARAGCHVCMYSTRCNYCHPGEVIRRTGPGDKPYYDTEYNALLKKDFPHIEAPFGIFV